tara:strand:- start:1083 stop:1820 length:738 start_codon:yes stop_codon:yes gene_type:complete
MYQKSQDDVFTDAVDVTLSATLRAPGASAAGIPSGQFTDTTANIAATAQKVIAFASGGTFLGSAIPSTRGTGGAPLLTDTGSQMTRTGASYEIETDGAGAITNVRVVQTRPAGATSAPTNPGAGPNLGANTQTIVFDATSLNNAFGQTNITGSLSIALAGTDLQPPTSGTDAGTDGVYEADPQSNGSFGLYVGATGDIKLELVGALTNQTVTIKSIPAGTILPLQARKILIGDASTTASEILALY